MLRLAIQPDACYAAREAALRVLACCLAQGDAETGPVRAAPRLATWAAPLQGCRQ
jgi:hypothetical protein